MPTGHGPARLGAAGAALVAVAAALADLVVVVVPPDHAFTLPEAIMVDHLLSALAPQHSSAFLLTARSPNAGQLWGLVSADGQLNLEALGRVAAACKASHAVVLWWRADGATAVFRGMGGQAVEVPVRLPEKVEGARQAAVALAENLAAAGLGDTTTGAAPTSAAPTGAAPGVPVPSPETTIPTDHQPPGSEPSREPAEPKTPKAGESPILEEPAAPAPSVKPAPPPSPETQAYPRQARLLLELATQSYREGNYQLALDRLDAALKAGAPRAEVLELEAKVYSATGDLARQVKALQELFGLVPGRSDVAVSLAMLLMEQGLWQEAVRVLDRAIAAAPDDPRLYLRLATIYQRQRRINEALSVLGRGMERTRHPDVGLALGAAYLGAGDIRAAQALYSQLALSEDASVRARALDALGDLYARVGDTERAVEAYVEAARARGEPAMLSTARYSALYAAVDGLVEGHVGQAWQFFGQLAAGNPAPPREVVLGALKTADAQVARASALCDEVIPPPELHKLHRQRQLYYALLREVLAAALTFVDTGRQDMAELARQRMKDALKRRPAGAQG
ncbi:MAG: tetratricopeptide repeat protein [Armatimonadetes bacterium]|nr:tetratricopeptide repeat protein [Armatimonadota bacterium]